MVRRPTTQHGNYQTGKRSKMLADPLDAYTGSGTLTFDGPKEPDSAANWFERASNLSSYAANGRINTNLSKPFSQSRLNSHNMKRH